MESVIKLLDRIARIKDRLDIKEGHGTNWDYVFENGEIHKYVLNGVKSPEEIEDDIAVAFVWLWSLKDHIKKSFKQGDFVESQINGNPYLCICADLANGEKHGGLDRPSRSGKNPRLGRLRYQIPQAAVGKLAFGAFNVSVDVNNAHLVVLEMPILDEGDQLIGDAFEYLGKCIDAWESIIDNMQKGMS